MKVKKRPLTLVMYLALIGITAVVIVAFGIIILPALAKKNASDEVFATVNGSPIYKKDIDAGLPKDAFGASLKYLRASRLDRLVYITVMKQFLKQENIQIKDQQVDKQIEYLRKNPPTSGCSCCRYASLEQFMRFNNYTMADLCEEIRVDMGLETYMDRLWQKKYPTKEKRLELVKENRQDIEKKYINVSHIFFNVFQDPEFELKQESVVKRKMRKASAALQRLENGEKFEIVVKDMSEDTVTREKGGELGCVWKKLFGPEFDRAADRLAPGQYSQPVQSLWGVHIIRLNKITDKDILTMLEKKFKDEFQEKIRKKLMDEAKIA